MRAPRRYIPEYDIPDFEAGIIKFLDKNPYVGRPKVPNDIKALKRDLKLFFLLTDICRLRLNKIRNNSFVADQLRKKFPDDYPPTRKTKAEKVVRRSLSKEVGAALKLLQNPTRLDELFSLYETACGTGQPPKTVGKIIISQFYCQPNAD
jgi:hypothetical protein